MATKLARQNRKTSVADTPSKLTGLIGLTGVSPDTIRDLLASTRDMHRVMSEPTPGGPLAGRIIANLFFEDSTRTRTSFSVAAKRLGGETVDLMGFASSMNKGETLVDTALNVEAMGVDAIVIRAKQSGSAAMIARACRVPIINAGDGKHEHPTQGLLDTYSVAEAHGRLDGFDLRGLKVVIVGDIASSRVARSAIIGLSGLGAKVICVGPPGLAPAGLKGLGCEVTHDLDPVLPGADAVMMLRMQFERHDGEGGPGGGSERKSSVIASVREYREGFAMTAERAERLKDNCVVMHPGPMNRGIEIDGIVADGPRSVILRQVTNGVAVRMAVLAACLTR